MERSSRRSTGVRAEGKLSGSPHATSTSSVHKEPVQRPLGHSPFLPWRLRSSATHPVSRVRRGSASQTSGGSSRRSRITCQRMTGSPARSHSTTGPRTRAEPNPSIQRHRRRIHAIGERQRKRSVRGGELVGMEACAVVVDCRCEDQLVCAGLLDEASRPLRTVWGEPTNERLSMCMTRASSRRVSSTSRCRRSAVAAARAGRGRRS